MGELPNVKVMALDRFNEASVVGNLHDAEFFAALLYWLEAIENELNASHSREEALRGTTNPP